MKKKLLFLLGAVSVLGAYYYQERRKKFDVPSAYRPLSMVTTPPWALEKPVVKAANELLSRLPRKDVDAFVSEETLNGVPVTIYSTTNEEAPVVLYFHGGAFVYEAGPHYHEMMADYANASGCTIVFVHYRPEAYPAPLADAIQVLKAVYETTGKPVGVAGDSAGGCLAAALSLWARDHGMPLQAQMLIYPVLDREMTSVSMQEYTDTPLWNARANRAMWENYTQNGDFGYPQYVSPMRETDLSGLPSTYIEAQQFDCLRDEDLEYGRRLFEAGVPVRTYLNKGLFHGFDVLYSQDKTREIVLRRARRLKEMMENV